MKTEQSQKTGSLDELAARLAARYQQEMQALKAAACQQDEAAPVSCKEPTKPNKTSQYSDEDTDAQMRAHSEGGAFGAAIAVESKTLSRTQVAAVWIVIWLAIGALTWLFAEPQIYATPALFVANILIRPQLAAIVALPMLAAIWLSMDVLFNPRRASSEVAKVVAFYGYLALAYCLAYPCGILFSSPGMTEVLVRCIVLYFSVLMCAPIIAILALIFPVLWLTFVPILLFHYLVDRVIIKTFWPVRNVPSVYEKR